MSTSTTRTLSGASSWTPETIVRSESHMFSKSVPRTQRIRETFIWGTGIWLEYLFSFLQAGSRRPRVIDSAGDVPRPQSY